MHGPEYTRKPTNVWISLAAWFAALALTGVLIWFGVRVLGEQNRAAPERTEESTGDFERPEGKLSKVEAMCQKIYEASRYERWLRPVTRVTFEDKGYTFYVPEKRWNALTELEQHRLLNSAIELTKEVANLPIARVNVKTGD